MSIAVPRADGARPVPWNALACALLALSAAALLPLHAAPWWPASPPAPRWWLAAASVLAYGAAARWSVVRARRRLHGDADLAAGDAVAEHMHALQHVPPSHTVLVAHASQTGTAQDLARRSAEVLRGRGVEARVLPLAALDAAVLARCRQLHVVASTTGEGDPPDAALAFAARLDVPAMLPQLRFSVLALGDRRYTAYCAFGLRVDRWLRDSGARPMSAPLAVDNADPVALQAWFDALARATADDRPRERSPGATPAPAVRPASPPPPPTWTLGARRLANPGSQGAEAWHVTLRPAAGAMPSWQAGDLVEVTPRNAPQVVAAALAALQVAPDRLVADALGRMMRLDALLARARLPEAPWPGGLDPDHVARGLPLLRGRAYSIASLPADGAIELLVRRHRRADGVAGVGSGWLCAHAPAGITLEARLRDNPAFHPPAPSRPLVLVGNGTGAAGLRAHLRARLAAGARRQWLLLGEREAARDAFYGDEFDALHASGALEALDRAWSRDGGGPRYVQDALAAQATRLRAWIDDGACVYVCGSAAGMAPGVDAVLCRILGEAAVDALRSAGRYRRDVY